MSLTIWGHEEETLWIYYIITVSFSFCSCVTYNDHCTTGTDFQVLLLPLTLLAGLDKTNTTSNTDNDPAISHSNSVRNWIPLNDEQEHDERRDDDYVRIIIIISPTKQILITTSGAELGHTIHSTVHNGRAGIYRGCTFSMGDCPKLLQGSTHSSVQPALDGVVVGGGGQATGWPGTITLHLSNVVRWH